MWTDCYDDDDDDDDDDEYKLVHGLEGCGRPLRGARHQRHTIAHNPSIEAF
jgi:hypothetical protein